MTSMVLPYHVRRDTLAYFKAQALCVPQSLREVEVPEAAKRAQVYMGSAGLRRPEAEATWFYALNAINAELGKRFAEDEPLPDWAVTLAETYVTGASTVARRLLQYLFLIVTRESRHAGSIIYSEMAEVHGEVYQQFNSYLNDAPGSMEAKSMFFRKPPKMKLGAYADAIVWTFRNAPFTKGFGGENWAVIADVFKGYVDGKLSAEMVTDTAWALCHNGGPIFNKEMVYMGYEKETLLKILDVQRSGQIPSLVLHGLISGDLPVWATYKTTRDAVVLAESHMPGVFKPTVDWDKVEQDGAVQSYAGLKPPALATGHYMVTPGKMVAVVAKERSAA